VWQLLRPKKVDWSHEGKIIHLGKIAFEKYFLHKIRNGIVEPFYEKYIFGVLGIEKLKASDLLGKYQNL
jgi:sulfide:quinone oxidoreductase